jgi:hypothetical protein
VFVSPLPPVAGSEPTCSLKGNTGWYYFSHTPLEEERKREVIEGH